MGGEEREVKTGGRGRRERKGGRSLLISLANFTKSRIRLHVRQDAA